MPYVDLNVRAGARVSAAELTRLGYACAGVNVECEGSARPKEASLVADLPQEITADKSGKAAKKAKQYAAALANSLTLQNNGVLTTTTGRQLRQLKRITLKVEDMNAAQAIMASPILKTYDIVAVECMNAKVFQFICEQGDAVDLITFDVANRIPFQLKKPWMDAAAKRGLYFELTYAACLGDSAGRRYFFSNAANLVRLTNGRHLVLSSGSSRDLFLRSPYDVVNVGILVGLTYGQAMDALTNAPLAVLDHAKTRRGKADVGMLSEAMEM